MTVSAKRGRRSLKTQAEFRRALTSGRKKRLGSLEVSWIPNDAGHARLGLIVPKFQSTAVARNRLRRQIREWWRTVGEAGCGAAVDVVVRTSPRAYRKTRADLVNELAEWVGSEWIGR